MAKEYIKNVPLVPTLKGDLYIPVGNTDEDDALNISVSQLKTYMDNNVSVPYARVTNAPSVNDTTVTVNMNGVSTGTFTLNASTAQTINLTSLAAPTTTSIADNAVTLAVQANTCYTLTSASLTSVTLTSIPSSTLESTIYFTTSTGTTLTLPQGYTYIGYNSQTLVDNTAYAIAIKDGLIVIGYDGAGTTVAWSNVTGKPTFATVATSGSYNDLTDKPTIPSTTETWTFELSDGTTVTKTVYVQ